MFSNRSAFTKGNWAVTLALLAVLVLSTVSPAFAAGGSISTIVVGSQGSALTYGTAGSASYTVSVTSAGSLSNVVFAISGLPAGASGAFSPAKLSFSGVQTKPTTLTITTTTAAAAVSNRPFTVSYKAAGKVGAATGSGSLTIGKASLGVQPPLVQDKAYDGTTNAVLNPGCSDVVTTNCAALTGVVNSDVVFLVTTNAHGAFDSPDVGVEVAHVTGLSLSGAAAGNYAVPADVETSATITAPVLTITANPAFKAAGFPDPAFTASYNGFVNGETAETALTSLPVCTVSGAHDDAGLYPISCSGAVGANYTFHYVDGTLTVNAADSLPTDISLSNASVAENQPIGTTVGNLTTTDPDSSLGESYSYSLVDTLSCAGPDNAAFQVAAGSSTLPVPLQTAAVLHFAAKSSYSICVETNDGNGGTFDKHFVISVQPSTLSFISNGINDGWILESGEFTNIGGTKNSVGTTLRVGDDVSNKQYRSILSFATGALPDNATILSVTIKVKKQALNNANIFTQLNGLRVDISKPAFGLVGLQVSDFQQAPASGQLLAGTFGATPDGSGWYSVSLIPNSLQFLNKAGGTQFRLHFGKDDNNNLKADILSLYSGNAILANRPQLIVVYSVP